MKTAVKSTLHRAVKAKNDTLAGFLCAALAR